MKKTLLTTCLALGISLGCFADIITQWNFNDDPSDEASSTGTLTPSIGNGTAGLVGTLTTTYNQADASTDPLGAGLNNSAWRMSGGWPTQGTGNKTCGVQLNINTSGYENITLVWDQANSGSASKYYRVQYSIDNGATWVDKDVIANNMGGNFWTNLISVSFATISGANNNPNFGVRILSEFQSTAVGGAPSYVPVGTGNYGTSGVLRFDMITFNGDIATGEVKILTDPASQQVAVGQPVTFEVTAAGGTTTITYQWRKGSTAIPTATSSAYTISAAQHSDAASYDVVVANAINSLTSSVAVLTVRDPLSLAWTGNAGTLWDTSSMNWVDTNAAISSAYTSGDHVLFDSRGAAAATVSLAESLNPNSVTVDANFDYTFRSDVGGKIVGGSGLTKRGTGTLIMDTDNSYSGLTTIQSGAVQIGAASAHGSTGTGPILNNSGLVFNRTDTLVFANTISGTGGITNIGKTVTLSGANTYNGPIAAMAGTLLLAGNQTVNTTDLFIFPSTATGASGATKFGIVGGMAVGAGTTLHLSGSTAVPDCRVTFVSSYGSNTLNGPIVLDGAGGNNLQVDGAGTELHVNGDISGPTLAPSGSFFLRGATGSGVLNGKINLPNNVVHKTDTGTWTINSTGNSWAGTTLAVGTLRLGAHNALPVSISLAIGQSGVVAALDLAGFNQQLAAVVDSPGAGTQIITNSSATADSTLTVGSGVFSGCIADSASGRKTSLTVNGGGFTLAGFNTYSGATTVQAGTLSISGVGDIPNCTVINLAGGALDVTGRNDGTLPLNGAQTLKGNGTLAITGNLMSSGTVELKVNKAGGVVSNDKVSITGQLISGGTLKLSLAGEALNSKDILQVFVATSYVGGVPLIEPAVPAPGAVWDTSTLLTDGKLRIYGPPMVTGIVISGSNITLSGIGGEAFATFSVLTSTDVAAPAASWTTLQSGAFDASGNFNISLPIVAGQPQRFYMLKMP